jgi:hypothetical protein
VAFAFRYSSLAALVAALFAPFYYGLLFGTTDGIPAGRGRHGGAADLSPSARTSATCWRARKAGSATRRRRPSNTADWDERRAAIALRPFLFISFK